MVDVIQVVGERIAYWSEINNPADGKGVFDRDRSDLRVEFKDIQYGEIHPIGYKPLTLQASTFENGTSTPDTQTFAVTKTTTSSFTYKFTESLAITLKATVKLPLLGETGLEPTLSFESTQAQTTSAEQSWSYSTEISVAPHKKVTTSFIVHEAQYHVPFTATVQVRGRVYIAFRATHKHFESEISDLIEFQWDPRTFEYNLTGIFDATHGNEYVVRVEESNLDQQNATDRDVSFILSSSAGLAERLRPLKLMR